MTDQESNKGRFLSRKLKPWHLIALGLLALVFLAAQFALYRSSADQPPQPEQSRSGGQEQQQQQ